MKDNGLMLFVLNDEIRMIMEYNNDNMAECFRMMNDLNSNYSFVFVPFKTDNRILQRYVMDRIVRKQHELTQAFIYETFSLENKDLENYVMNVLLKNVR